MNEDKLKIIILFKNYFLEIYDILLNCNKKHLELKHLVIDECALYLKELYLANDIVDDMVRKNKKEELVIRLKYISSLLAFLYKYELISHKKYLKLGNDLEVILRLMNGWKKK